VKCISLQLSYLKHWVLKSNLRLEIRSGQIKDRKIGIYCFSSKHDALSRKSKEWLSLNQDNSSEWNDIYTCGLFFQLARTMDLASLFSIGCWDCSDSVVFDCFFHFICLPFRAKWLYPCFIAFVFLIFSFLCLLTFVVVWFTFFSYYFLILYDFLKSWNCLRSHIRTLECFVRNSSTTLKDINSVRLLPGIIRSGGREVETTPICIWSECYVDIF
jgi:hypothetical protein